MKSGIRHLVLIALMSLSAAWAQTEAKDVKFPDSYAVGNESLSLNGQGIRSKDILDAYALALYVKKKDHTAEGLLAQAGPKSLQIVVLRDLRADTIAIAMVRGFKKNNSDAVLGAYQSQLEEMRATLAALGNLNKGMVVRIDFDPSKGASVWMNGTKKGNDIAGEAFYAAFLKVWLGDTPVDAELKKALLGD